MTSTRTVRRARAALRLAAFLAVSLAFAALYVPSMALSRWRQLQVQQWWCGGVARVAGLRTTASGAPAGQKGRACVYLVNHVSYFDIPAFGRLVPATFVAKSEVAAWPLFGWFARLTGTVFIPRRAGHSAAQVALLQGRLSRGESLILFPEGTHSDGSDVLPFKSSLLQSVVAGTDDTQAIVQPVSVVYTRLASGEPLVGERRSLYAWIDFDDMFPHLWRALGRNGADVRVIFHPPLPPADCRDRKRLASAAEIAVRDGVLATWRGVGEIEPPFTS